MINIIEKKNCCGCGACMQKCPKHCISLQEDNEGFLYPQIDESLCVECGLCEKVCPVIHQEEGRKPIDVYAARNKNERIRIQSSSGGIFTVIAESVINSGGVVFGAKFAENWEVKHDFTETVEGLAPFRGSKYVQSRIGDSYHQAETFLKQGRRVLFSGTPCQIAGLKKFLCREYDNLVTLDFVCHGVPSPGVWRRYLKETINSYAPYKNNQIGDTNIDYISFRDKRLGWKKFSLSMSFNINKNIIKYSKSKYNEPYLIGFLRDLYLRPSCHNCPTKCFSSNSDVTIADFWSINKFMKEKNDHKGYSLCFIHNEKISLDVNELELTRLNSDEVCLNNVTIYKSAAAHINRSYFFEQFNKTENYVTDLIKHFATVSVKTRIRLLIANILNN